MEAGRGLMMIRSGPWKLIDGPGSGGFSKSPEPGPGDPPGQLYNLREDPAERDNLYQKNPDKAAELSRLMKAIVDAQATRSH
jgi:arylsulfatase A-like enzyme